MSIRNEYFASMDILMTCLMGLYHFTVFVVYYSTKGAFTPSGYFLKAVFLHSGQAVSRYSDPLYDAEPTRIASFELLSQPVDVFQGKAGLLKLVYILSDNVSLMFNCLLHIF